MEEIREPFLSYLLNDLEVNGYDYTQVIKFVGGVAFWLEEINQPEPELRLWEGEP